MGELQRREELKMEEEEGGCAADPKRKGEGECLVKVILCIMYTFKENYLKALLNSQTI